MTENASRPTDSASLLAYTETHWQVLTEYVDALPETTWEGPADAAGWTAKDHVAHVMRWDESMIGLIRDGTPRRVTLQVSEAARTAGGFDAMNAEIRQQTLGDSVETIKQRRDRIWTKVRAMLQGIDDAALQRPAIELGMALDDNPTLLEALCGDLGEHYEEHLGYIRTIVEGVSE